MKKLIIFILILVILLSACNSPKVIPEEFTIINESDLPVSTEYVCIYKAFVSFDTLISTSSHIVKFKVNEIIYFKHEMSYTNNNGRTISWNQLSIAYEITVQEVLFGNEIKKNKSYFIYLPYMEEKTNPPLKWPEVDKEYYAFLTELNENLDEVLLNFIDYTFTDNEIGIVSTSVTNEKRLLTTIENFTK